MVQVEDLKTLEEEAEVNYKIEKQTLLSKYQIPIHHLDFDYVNVCENPKELEKIYEIIKSGEEGYYPQLLTVTEDRLKIIKPNSKLLREVCPVLKKDEIAKDEWSCLSNDLSEWMKDVNKKDSELSGTKIKSCSNCDAEIRQSTKELKPIIKDIPKRIASTDYDSWDKYDPDTEILKMDLQEEKVKTKALENQDKLKKSKVVRFSNFATEAEAHYEANCEKERGNESFKAGEFKDALRHYTNSIQCKPLAVGYTNRALIYIKLKKYDLAISDCKEALKLEPKCFKAYLRMAQSYDALKEYNEALKFVTHAIQTNPNNICAQELSSRLHHICGESSHKIRFAIEDVDSSNTCNNKPFKPILKRQPKNNKEIIAIPGSSKMLPPYYVEVASKDPEIVKREKQKILNSTSKLLHITVIDPPSDDEIEELNSTQKDYEEVTLKTCASLAMEKKKIHSESVDSPQNSNVEIEEDKPRHDQHLQVQDVRAGGEPYNTDEQFTVLEEDLQFPYTFTKLWNSAKKDGSYTHQAEILRKVDFHSIHEVIGYNLDEDMLSGIIRCLHQHFMVPNEVDRVRAALSNFNRIPRFQMMLLFLSNTDRKYIKQLMEFLDQHDRNLENEIKNIYNN